MCLSLENEDFRVYFPIALAYVFRISIQKAVVESKMGLHYIIILICS